MHLLDVNVLIALGDASHVHHARVQQWFHSVPDRQWATCPLTENAFIRIVGGPSYPAASNGPESIRQALSRMCAVPGHHFWNDDLTLRDTGLFPALPTARQPTDLYLLALAVSRQARFATLDERINPDLTPGGRGALELIP